MNQETQLAREFKLSQMAKAKLEDEVRVSGRQLEGLKTRLHAIERDHDRIASKLEDAKSAYETAERNHLELVADLEMKDMEFEQIRLRIERLQRDAKRAA